MMYNLIMNSYQSYYPRPMLKRDSFFSLCGEWNLNGKTIIVPFPPQSDLSGYQGDMEHLEYTKTFSLPEDFYHKNDKVILHFGAVDQLCEVYLNNHLITKHEGGYLPFSIDISDVIEDNNQLRVIVTDTLDTFYPYGKQSKKPSGMWYTPVSGIWQSVWIEAYDAKGIDDLKISTTMDTLKIHIESLSKNFAVSFDGYNNSFNTKDIEIKIDNPHLWSTDDPYLYTLKIKTANDEIESYFALKQIQVKEINGVKRFFLNNKPVFINGLLDQGYFKDGIFTPEKIESYEEDIVGIKQLGFNCLRKHIKIEPEAFYYCCDKNGILVIQDMVNSGDYGFIIDTILPTIGITNVRKKIKDQKRYDFFVQHCKDTISHLSSHPCIIGYTIYNEGWGQQNASEVYEILKPLDNERLFDSTSGWFFDDKSDFDSYHIYFRNKVLNTGKRVLLLSECGGFIRSVKDHSPQGKKWGYGKAESEEELTSLIINMYEKMYKPSIINGLCGAIMTQISDVEGEINGLYTYDRQVLKVNKEKILQANQDLQHIYEKQCI